MGCGASSIPPPPPPCPTNAIDIFADFTNTKDGSHAYFDMISNSNCMPKPLKNLVLSPSSDTGFSNTFSDQLYTEVLQECTTIIKNRTKSEECCTMYIICAWIVMIFTCMLTMDMFIGKSFKCLDGCDEVVKRWEKCEGVIGVRFYKGGYGGNVNRIRVWLKEGEMVG